MRQHQEQFLWGSFPFSELGYGIQASSPGLPPREAASLWEAVDETVRRQITRLAESISSGELVSVFAMSLPDGYGIVGWAFGTGCDDVGRRGAYAVHGIMAATDSVSALLARQRQMIQDGNLRLGWTGEEVSALSNSELELEPFDRHRAQRELALRWCDIAEASVTEGWDDTPLSGGYIAVVGGQLHMKRAESNQGRPSTPDKEGQKRRSRRVVAVCLSLLVAVTVGFLAGYGFNGCHFLSSHVARPPGGGTEPRPDNGQQWRKDLERAVAYCAEKWGLGADYKADAEPVQRVFHLVGEISEQAPTLEEVQRLDDWLAKSGDDEVTKRLGESKVAQKLQAAFRAASRVPVPSGTVSEESALRYVTKVAAMILSKDVPRSSCDDVLLYLQGDLLRRVGLLSLDLLEDKIAEANLPELERQALLSTVRKHQRFLNSFLGVRSADAPK